MSTISRSKFQQKVEENKRLVADIRVLVSAEQRLSADYILILLKWRKYFAKENMINSALKDAALKYLDEHPEFKILRDGNNIGAQKDSE